MQRLLRLRPALLRDVLRETISLDGMPLHIVDTAGLRESDNEIELEGIRRAWLEIEKADQVLFLVDANETDSPDLTAIWPEYFARFGESSAAYYCGVE